ncbi:hypothetical protein B0H13DRAFT_2678968 [Mycena leptocephala]|nr:hypothetical protein B0H13DRAFT_2678968 [Mycena leptocephala]
MSRRSPDASTYSTQLVLGLAIPGVSLTAALLILYAYAAWNIASRRYLDRVSFRLLVYALLAHLAFGIILAAGTVTGHSGWRCELQSFVTNLSLMVSAGMFFCMALNLQLVLAHGVNGQNMEKYYILGTTLVCLICNVTPYAAGKLGRAVDGTCWYSSTEPAEISRWLIGTQTFWILLASVGEVSAFGIILGYLIVHKLNGRYPRADTQPSATHTSGTSRRAGPTILKFWKIIIRIGETPPISQGGARCIIYACLLNISTAVLDLRSEKSDLSWPLVLTDLAIYAGRPLIYGLLAATDPSFTRAMRALRHPESDSETGANHPSRSAQWAATSGRLSTVIIETPPDESVLGEFDKEDFREHSQIMASTWSTLGTAEQYTNTQRGQIAGSTALNQQVSLIDVVCHI